jgi:hypothetical protein
MWSATSRWSAAEFMTLPPGMVRVPVVPSTASRDGAALEYRARLIIRSALRIQMLPVSWAQWNEVMGSTDAPGEGDPSAPILLTSVAMVSQFTAALHAWAPRVQLRLATYDELTYLHCWQAAAGEREGTPWAQLADWWPKGATASDGEEWYLEMILHAPPLLQPVFESRRSGLPLRLVWNRP